MINPPLPTPIDAVPEPNPTPETHPASPLAQRLALAGEGSDRHDGWTTARMAAFCEVLAATGSVDSARHHRKRVTTTG